MSVFGTDGSAKPWAELVAAPGPAPDWWHRGDQPLCPELRSGRYLAAETRG